MERSVLSCERYAQRVEQDSLRLAQVARATGLEAAVPSCPPWRMGELLRHLGHVQRWASRYVLEGVREMLPEEPEVEMVRHGPPDPELAGWLERGARRLAEALRRAPADLQCWTFLPAPSPLLFWARRQAHEAVIHRVDGELVQGAAAPLPADFAADGCEELLRGFAWRHRRLLKSPEPISARIEATDSGDSWSVRAGPDGLALDEGTGAVDGIIRGTASDLYLLTWNRLGPEAVEVRGAARFLEWWRGAVQVTWE